LYINELPDAFQNVKNSIGCILKKSDVLQNLDILKESHFAFIALASQKKLRTSSEKAHAKGAILYLSKELGRAIPNPTYSQQTINSLISEEKEALEIDLREARTKSKEERAEKLRLANPKPDTKSVEVVVFKRNAYVVLEVLERANGICERCKKSAPFLTDKDNRPYLEVHHKIPLAENGDDTVANAIALCPNCHRHAHYGKNSYGIIT
jgi:predicted HNH restriction endonuclease